MLIFNCLTFLWCISYITKWPLSCSNVPENRKERRIEDILRNQKWACRVKPACQRSVQWAVHRHQRLSDQEPWKIHLKGSFMQPTTLTYMGLQSRAEIPENISGITQGHLLHCRLLDRVMQKSKLRKERTIVHWTHCLWYTEIISLRHIYVYHPCACNWQRLADVFFFLSTGKPWRVKSRKTSFLCHLGMFFFSVDQMWDQYLLPWAWRIGEEKQVCMISESGGNIGKAITLKWTSLLRCFYILDKFTLCTCFSLLVAIISHLL